MGYYNIGDVSSNQLDLIEDSLNTQLGLPSDAAPANFSSNSSVIGLLKRIGTTLESILNKAFGWNKATAWTASVVTTTATIAEAVAADNNAAKATIENRGSATIYFSFGGSAAPTNTTSMLKLPPGFGWLEEGNVSAAHLKIWAGGGISSILIARWTA